MSFFNTFFCPLHRSIFAYPLARYNFFVTKELQKHERTLYCFNNQKIASKMAERRRFFKYFFIEISLKIYIRLWFWISFVTKKCLQITSCGNSGKKLTSRNQNIQYNEKPVLFRYFTMWLCAFFFFHFFRGTLFFRKKLRTFPYLRYIVILSIYIN